MDKLSLLTLLQIVSEMIPISSSGHLSLYMNTFQTTLDVSTMSLWMHLIHLPTLVVVGIYFGYKRITDLVFSYLPIIIMSDSITVVAFLIKKKNLIPHIPLVVGFSATLLLLGSLRVVTSGGILKANYWFVGLLVGCAQAAALLIPGLSRLATVFVLLSWIGASSRSAFELAWLVQLPLMGAASIHAAALLYTHHQLIPLIQAEGGAVIVGTLVSLGTLYLALYLLNQWYYFAWYMILPIITALYIMH